MANPVIDQINALAEFFQKKSEDQARYANEEKQARLKSLLQQQAQQEAIKQTEEMAKKHPGLGVTVSPEGAGLHPVGALLTTDLKQEQQTRRETEAMSKRFEKINDFANSLKQLNDLTNRDGKGGILQNPDAKLVSTGATVSAMPDTAVAMAEKMHALPKGTSEERKALARVVNEYAFAKSGARTNPALIQREKEAMGWLASGDPNLVAKGVRSLAKNMQQHTKTIKAGYSPEAIDRFTSQAGDPEETFSNVYEEPARPVTGGLFGPRAAKPAPTMAAPVAPQAPGTFDPDAYLKGNR